MDLEAGMGSGGSHGSRQSAAMGQLFGIATGLAEQEITDMGGAGMGAADKGIARGYAVYQVLLLQEFQGAIDRGRCRLVAFGRELVEQLIGAQGPVAMPDQLQHAPAQGGEAGAAVGAQALGGGQRIVHAMAVIMAGAMVSSSWQDRVRAGHKHIRDRQ